MAKKNSIKTTGIMSKKEAAKSMAQFNKRPGEKSKLNAIRKKNKAMAK